MKTVYVLQLQGTGDDEYAYENAGVFTTRTGAVAKLATINVDYEDYVPAFFVLDENARIEKHTLNLSLIHI